MGTETFVISDTHFGHAGVCKFTRDDGCTPLRPWDDPDEMDEAMIANWNSVVRPSDKVYHLGDVVINRKALKTLARLNGDKVLIRGNHDIFRDEEYREYFRELRAYHIMNGMIFSHIPIHTESLGRFGTNVHGHLHANRVLLENRYRGPRLIDVRYHCVCVEHTSYTPISLDELYKKIAAEGGKVGFSK